MKDMNLSLAYIVVLLFVGIALLVFAYGLFTLPNRKNKRPPLLKKTGVPGTPGVCPICGTVLNKNEQIKTALYPGEDDRICHIFGCPHCHPYADENTARRCPVCKKPLPAEGYLFARLFSRPGNKNHVHILGCSSCRLSKKKN